VLPARVGVANPSVVARLGRRSTSHSQARRVSVVSGDVENDPVPVSTMLSNPPTAASGVTCSTTVPYAVPLMRPSQTRTMSRTPVPEACSYRQVGIRAFPDSPSVRSPEERARVDVDVEIRVIDARVHIFDAVEDHRLPRWYRSSGVAAAGFMIAPPRARLREVRRSRIRNYRGFANVDDFLVPDCAFSR